MAILQTLFILKAQWLTCPDSKCLKTCTSGCTLSHGSRTYYVSCADLHTQLCATLTSQIWTTQQLFRCSRWESKKRWCMIKQTAPCTRHSSGSPNCFSNRKSYAVCICICMCLSIWSFRWVGRPYWNKKTASLLSLFLVFTQHYVSLCATQ